MKKTVLYVDDEFLNREMFLMECGMNFNVVLAENTKTALENLENMDSIDAVVSDLNMPDETGIDFIKRAKEKYPEKKYFILSGEDQTNEISQALQQGIINGYFKKPLNTFEFLRLINE